MKLGEIGLSDQHKLDLACEVVRIIGYIRMDECGVVCKTGYKVEPVPGAIDQHTFDLAWEVVRVIGHIRMDESRVVSKTEYKVGPVPGEMLKDKSKPMSITLADVDLVPIKLNPALKPSDFNDLIKEFTRTDSPDYLVFAVNRYLKALGYSEVDDFSYKELSEVLYLDEHGNHYHGVQELKSLGELTLFSFLIGLLYHLIIPGVYDEQRQAILGCNQDAISAAIYLSINSIDAIMLTYCEASERAALERSLSGCVIMLDELNHQEGSKPRYFFCFRQLAPFAMASLVRVNQHHSQDNELRIARLVSATRFINELFGKHFDVPDLTFDHRRHTIYRRRHTIYRKGISPYIEVHLRAAYAEYSGDLNMYGFVSYLTSTFDALSRRNHDIFMKVVESTYFWFQEVIKVIIQYQDSQDYGNVVAILSDQRRRPSPLSGGELQSFSREGDSAAYDSYVENMLKLARFHSRHWLGAMRLSNSLIYRIKHCNKSEFKEYADLFIDYFDALLFVDYPCRFTTPPQYLEKANKEREFRHKLTRELFKQIRFLGDPHQLSLNIFSYAARYFEGKIKSESGVIKLDGRYVLQLFRLMDLMPAMCDRSKQEIYYSNKYGVYKTLFPYFALHHALHLEKSDMKQQFYLYVSTFPYPVAFRELVYRCIEHMRPDFGIEQLVKCNKLIEGITQYYGQHQQGEGAKQRLMLEKEHFEMLAAEYDDSVKRRRREAEERKELLAEEQSSEAERLMQLDTQIANAFVGDAKPVATLVEASRILLYLTHIQKWKSEIEAKVEAIGLHEEELKDIANHKLLSGKNPVTKKQKREYKEQKKRIEGDLNSRILLAQKGLAELNLKLEVCYPKLGISVQGRSSGDISESYDEFVGRIISSPVWFFSSHVRNACASHTEIDANGMIQALCEAFSSIAYQDTASSMSFGSEVKSRFPGEGSKPDELNHQINALFAEKENIKLLPGASEAWKELLRHINTCRAIPKDRPVVFKWFARIAKKVMGLPPSCDRPVDASFQENRSKLVASAAEWALVFPVGHQCISSRTVEEGFGKEAPMLECEPEDREEEVQRLKGKLRDLLGRIKESDGAYVEHDKLAEEIIMALSNKHINELITIDAGSAQIRDRLISKLQSIIPDGKQLRNICGKLRVVAGLVQELCGVDPAAPPKDLDGAVPPECEHKACLSDEDSQSSQGGLKLITARGVNGTTPAACATPKSLLDRLRRSVSSDAGAGALVILAAISGEDGQYRNKVVHPSPRDNGCDGSGPVDASPSNELPCVAAVEANPRLFAQVVAAGCNKGQEIDNPYDLVAKLGGVLRSDGSLLSKILSCVAVISRTTLGSYGPKPKKRSICRRYRNMLSHLPSMKVYSDSVPGCRDEGKEEYLAKCLYFCFSVVNQFLQQCDIVDISFSITEVDVPVRTLSCVKRELDESIADWNDSDRNSVIEILSTIRPDKAKSFINGDSCGQVQGEQESGASCTLGYLP